MIYVEILAGGKGNRFTNAEMPKQFLNLGTKPIIIHTIEQFLYHDKVDKIIVCCIKEWEEHLKNILEVHLKDNLENIAVVSGGKDRTDSILNGCEFIKKEYGINDNDIVIMHDAVRPFVSYRIITDNINAMENYSGADTVVPAIDTIVNSKIGEIIDNIPLRDELYYGQTPQTFKLKEIMEAYKNIKESDKDILTDACKVMLMNKGKVKLVGGEYYNIKITNIYDLKLANAILESELNI